MRHKSLRIRLNQLFTFERTALLCSAVVTLGAFGLVQISTSACSNEICHQQSMMDLAGRYYAAYSMARH